MKKKYSKEYFSEIVKNSYSIADVLRKLELCPIGGSYKTVHKYIELYDLDTSHFTGMRWNKGLKRADKSAIVKLDEILKENTSYKSAYLKERLIKEGLKKERCERCKKRYNDLGEKLTLELHHINGNHYDNRLENLQILCTDCHSKTNGYRVPKNCGDIQNIIYPYDEHKAKVYYCKNCGNKFISNKKRTFCSIDCYHEYLGKLRDTSYLDKDILIKEIENCNSIQQLSDKLHSNRTSVREALKKYGLYEAFKEKYDFHSKAIIQLDLNGNIIKEWPSITDAEETLNISGINKCLSGKRRSSGGFIWRYKK